MFHRFLPFRALRFRACATIALAVMLGACATDASREAFRHSETELEAAREHGSVECRTPGDCEQAWARARRFVQTHSPTSVERLTDDTIETRMPHEFGVAYFWAVRRMTGNGTAVIRLKGLCRGMYGSDGGPGWIYRHCAGQLRDAQIEFARVVGDSR